MLQLFGAGVISLWLQAMELQPPAPQDWLAYAVPALSQTQLATPTLEPYLQQLAQEGFAPTNQGIWIQAGETLLANHRGAQPLPAASLTKVATSLVALQTWGPNHQFLTEISATGPIRNGILQGDLVIQGGGDPLFVWEEAISLGNTLNQLGITRVSGDLIISGNFAMNYETEPLLAGTFLREGLNAGDWSPEVQALYWQMPSGTPRPQVVIAGAVRSMPTPPVPLIPLIRHRSLPLTQLIKQMNIYSNNAMAEMLAVQLGGASVIARQAAIAAQVPAAEIQLVNGSGLSPDNRMSPRAVCGLFQALQRLIQPQLSLADLFPVSGRDLGTLELREIPEQAVVKTGTLWNVSTLAGMLPNREYGPTWFAIMNYGEGIDRFRQQQDQLLQSLEKQWGPAPGRASQVPLAPRRLGEPQRNEVLLVNRP